MKRRTIFFVTLLVLSSMLIFQSCEDEAGIPPKEYTAPVPGAPVPAVAAVVPFTGANQAINLAWAGTGSSAAKWDVYFGDSEDPDKVATGLTTNAYTARVPAGGTYYWYVYTIDANKVETFSPVWEFQVNSNPDVPVLTSPANNVQTVSKTAALEWTSSDPEDDHLTYDVYLGTTSPPAPVATNVATETYTPTLAYNTTYYWKVVSKDPYGGIATSAISTFKTDVQQPDYNVFNGVADEICTSFSATAKKNVTVQRLGTSNTLSLFLPIADGMVGAGWGTVYTGTHPIIINYDPVTLAVTSTKQAWCDSFIDPTEMGPMSLQVSTGSINPLTKTITIRWKVSGNAYWGADYVLGTATYTMK